MAKKELAINMAANIIAFAVQFGINFLFTPYLIRTVGKEAYGFFPLANSFIGYAGIITIALDSMASRFITICLEQNNTEGANIYFNSVLRGNTYISIAITIPSVLMVIFADKLLNIPPNILADVQWLFGLIFLGSIITIMTSVYNIATFAKNKLHLSSIRNAESNIIRVAVLLLLFYFFQPTILYFGIANLIVVFFIFYTNKTYTRKLLPEIKISTKYYRKSAIRELLSSGVWNSVNQLSLIILTSLDLLIANVLLGASEAGEYSLVKIIPMFIQSLVGMLVGVFVPEFTILYAQNKKEELLKSINRSVKIMGIIMTIPLGFVLVWGDVFFKLWVPNQNFEKLYWLSFFTIIPLVITTSMNTIYNVYTVTNKLKTPAMVLLATGVINTIIIVILLKITNWGLFVIPIVSMIIGMSRNLIFTPIYASRCLDVKWNTFYIAILRGILCCLIIVSTSLMIREFFTPKNWIEFITLAIIIGLIVLPLNILVALNKNERIAIQKMVYKTIRKINIFQ